MKPALLLLLSGCAATPPIFAPQQPVLATNSAGAIFLQLRPETPVVGKPGEWNISLWRKIQPMNTNNLYTPSLNWLLDTNAVPSFQSVMQ